MSQELCNRDKIKSASAVNEYCIQNAWYENKNVIVQREGITIFDDEVEVSVSNMNSYFLVNIMWEENGCDYKEKGLYGYYSTYYNKMKYHNDISYIYSDKNVIRIV